MQIRELIDFPVDSDFLAKKFDYENEDVKKNWMNMWVENLERNIKEVGDFSKYSVFKVGFDNTKTAVLVGGGHSLAKNISDLAKMDRTKIVMFTSSHTLKYLLANGITPDYVMVVDAKDIQASWLDIGEESKKITLMMEICASSKIFDVWKGSILFFRSNPKDIFPELWEKTDFDGMIYGGGNVMTALLTYAVDSAGFKRVVFVGHDYCNNVDFGVSYADGYVDLGHDNQDPYQDYSMHCDIDGLGKPTLERMIGYKLWTDLFTTTHKAEFINATEGGILGAYSQGNIKTVKQMRLKDVEV